MTLTAKQILAFTDLEKEEVEVPEWGGSVTIQAFS